jgi:hypothetical protein
MASQKREQKKMQLVYRSQLHRLQLETQLLQSRRPLTLASSFMGGVASWSVLGKLAVNFGKIHPGLGKFARLLKMVGVLLAVAKILRNK